MNEILISHESFTELSNSEFHFFFRIKERFCELDLYFSDLYKIPIRRYVNLINKFPTEFIQFCEICHPVFERYLNEISRLNEYISNTRNPIINSISGLYKCYVIYKSIFVEPDCLQKICLNKIFKQVDKYHHVSLFFKDLRKVLKSTPIVNFMIDIYAPAWHTCKLNRNIQFLNNDFFINNFNETNKIFSKCFISNFNKMYFDFMYEQQYSFKVFFIYYVYVPKNVNLRSINLCSRCYEMYGYTEYETYYFIVKSYLKDYRKLWCYKCRRVSKFVAIYKNNLKLYDNYLIPGYSSYFVICFEPQNYIKINYLEIDKKMYESITF